MSNKACIKCGTINPGNYKFCGKCGSNLESAELAKVSNKKTIAETRCTCVSCGNIWHYGKSEIFENTSAAMSNAGKSMMCCTCCLPAAFIPDKKIVDLDRCPKCGSKAVKTEQVVHEID